jgi:hypothetical protein
MQVWRQSEHDALVHVMPTSVCLVRAAHVEQRMQALVEQHLRACVLLESLVDVNAGTLV